MNPAPWASWALRSITVRNFFKRASGTLSISFISSSLILFHDRLSTRLGTQSATFEIFILSTKKSVEFVPMFLHELTKLLFKSLTGVNDALVDEERFERGEQSSPFASRARSPRRSFSLVLVFAFHFCFARIQTRKQSSHQISLF